MPPQAEFYTDAYLKTHMQRYQMALQMVQQQKATEFMVAQMLSEQIRNLDRQIASIKGASSSSEFNQLIKAYQLKQSVISDSKRRQIQIAQDVNDIFDTSSALPSISNAADTFAKSLATAGSIESKTKRSAGSVGGYSRSTDQAKAVAAATYTNFKADAYRNGQQIKFDANDATIRKAIAQTMGVLESDIDTVDNQREAMLKDRLDKQGGQAVDDTTLDQLIKDAGAQPGQTTPSQTKGAVEQLLQRRTALETQQTAALQKATATPEAQMQQAKQLYRSQFAPKATQRKANFENYLLTLSQPQQQIFLGYENTTPRQAKFMFGPRQKIAGDPVKEAAYDLYYAAQKERRQGKAPGYLIHTKVEELFPNDQAKQQQVLGLIFRATEIETQSGIEKAQTRTQELKDLAAKKAEKAIKKEQDDRNMFEKGFDAFMGLFGDRIDTGAPAAPVDIPTEEDVIFDESGGSINIQGDVEEQAPEEIPDPPADVENPLPTPPFDPSIYTIDNPFVTKAYDDGKRKGTYSYFIKPDGSYGMIGLSGTEVDISSNTQALGDAQKEFEAFKAAQEAAPQE